MLATRPRPDIVLHGPAATDGLARRAAPLLGAGDVLLLEGPVGAGKTAFARALIGALRERAGLPPEDVPSPTFTLVQTYDAGAFDVWHADLYRVQGPDDARELGLAEAFETALCLVEWPDRLGEDRPARAATLRLTHEGADARGLSVLGADGPAERLRALLDGEDRA